MSNQDEKRNRKGGDIEDSPCPSLDDGPGTPGAAWHSAESDSFLLLAKLRSTHQFQAKLKRPLPGLTQAYFSPSLAKFGAFVQNSANISSRFIKFRQDYWRFRHYLAAIRQHLANVQKDKKARNMTWSPHKDTRIIGKNWKMRKHDALKAKIGYELAENEPRDEGEQRTK